MSNSFWVYEISRGRWSVIYRNENGDADYWQRRQSLEPRPRYSSVRDVSVRDVL